MESSGLADESSNYEKEWNLDFHGVFYTIYITVNEGILTIEAEQSKIESELRWVGDFTAQYIEEITQKAGNFKKFPVFIKMLCSAFSRESESVFVDLLTYNDLELLKARKTGQSVNSSMSTSASFNSSLPTNPKSLLKRYVILTYTGEFDRVHFPLPLNHEDTVTVDSLRRTVKRLRKKIDLQNEVIGKQIAKMDKEETASEKSFSIGLLRKENADLKSKLRLLENKNITSNGESPSKSYHSKSPGPHQNVLPEGGDLAAAYLKLKSQYDTNRTQLIDLSAAFERLRTEASRELAIWKKRAAASDLKDEDSLNTSNTSKRKLEARLAKVQTLLLKERTEREREREANRRAFRRLRRKQDETLHMGNPLVFRRSHGSSAERTTSSRYNDTNYLPRTGRSSGGSRAGEYYNTNNAMQRSMSLSLPRPSLASRREQDRDRDRYAYRTRIRDTSRSSVSPANNRLSRQQQQQGSRQTPRPWGSGPGSPATTGGRMSPASTGRLTSGSAYRDEGSSSMREDLSDRSSSLQRRERLVFDRSRSLNGRGGSGYSSAASQSSAGSRGSAVSRSSRRSTGSVVSSKSLSSGQYLDRSPLPNGIGSRGSTSTTSLRTNNGSHRSKWSSGVGVGVAEKRIHTKSTNSKSPKKSRQTPPSSSSRAAASPRSHPKGSYRSSRGRSSSGENNRSNSISNSNMTSLRPGRRNNLSGISASSTSNVGFTRGMSAVDGKLTSNRKDRKSPDKFSSNLTTTKTISKTSIEENNLRVDQQLSNDSHRNLNNSNNHNNCNISNNEIRRNSLRDTTNKSSSVMDSNRSASILQSSTHSQNNYSNNNFYEVDDMIQNNQTTEIEVSGAERGHESGAERGHESGASANVLGVSSDEKIPLYSNHSSTSPQTLSLPQVQSLSQSQRDIGSTKKRAGDSTENHNRNISQLGSKSHPITSNHPPTYSENGGSGSGTDGVLNTTTTTTSTSVTADDNDSDDEQEEEMKAGVAVADISDIDRRIQALQSFLDRARTGILKDEDEEDANDATVL